MMNLELSEQAQAFVKSKMETGHFSTEGEAVTYYLEALQAWEQQKQQIRASVQQGLDDHAAGRYTTISSSEEADDDLKRLIDEADAARNPPHLQ